MKKQSRSKGEKYRNAALSSIAAAFFIAITSILPLYMPRWQYAIITKQKTELFIMFTAFAAIAALAALFLTTTRFQVKDYFVPNEPPRLITVSEWALIIFLVLTLLSAIFSPWQDFVWRGFTTNGINGRWEGFWAFLCYALTFIIVSRFYRPKRLHFLIFAVAAVLVSLYGILQYLGIDVLTSAGYFELHDTSLTPLTSNFRTTLGNINIVSAYCSLIIVLFAAMYAGEDSKWGFLYLTASAMAFAMLCITRGNAGQVGVLGAMILMIPYWLSDRRRLGKILIAAGCWSAVYASNQAYILMLKSRPTETLNQADFHFLSKFEPRSPALFFIAAVLLLAMGLFLVLLLKKWPGRLMKIAGAAFLAITIVGGVLFVEVAGSRSEDPNNILWQAREVMHGRIDDSFGSYRGWVWRNGMDVISDNPLLGTGPDTFFFALGGEPIDAQPTESTPYPDIVKLGGRQLESMTSFNQWFDKAHNTFLQIAVCMGIPALLAYLVFLGGLFAPAARKAFSRPFLLAFAAAALSYLIQSFFQIDTPIDRPLLYVALGVVSGELWRERIGT